MEQAILALLGISITLTLYLDRGRRTDNAKLRQDMNNGNTQLRQELNDGNSQVRQEMRDGLKAVRAENAKLRDDMNDGFKHIHSRLDKLTDIVMDLCHRIGRLEGRAEAMESRPDGPQ